MRDYRVRYLVLTSAYEMSSTHGEDYGRQTKQTIVERISAETVEKARQKAEELATIRSKKAEKWLVKAIEEVN